MSLVSTWVQSLEGSWYKNPTLRYLDWFVCWDDDEPIELVLRDRATNLEACIGKLRSLGWDVSVIGSTIRSGAQRAFAKDLKDFDFATSAFLRQKHGPPDELLQTHGHEPHDEVYDRQCVMYHNGVAS